MTQPADLFVAASRSGCAVSRVGSADTVDGRKTAGLIVCPTGWASARLLLELCKQDAERPEVRALAGRLAEGRSVEGFARTAHAFVKARVRFEREEGEIFQGAMHSLAIGVGDCDDHARLLFALWASRGLPCRLGFLGKKGGDPKHVWAEVQIGDRWYPGETTVDARFGEDPLSSAVRLGVVRRDMLADPSTEVSTMAGYPASLDSVLGLQEALAKLGCPPGPCDGLMGPKTRAAIRKFQADHPNAGRVDGIAGPKTKGAIGDALAELERAGVGSIESLPTPIGSVPVLLTRSWTDDDYRTLRDIGQRVGFSPRDLFGVMMNESGAEPSALNPSGAAAGLIQFSASTLPGLGWSAGTAAFAQLPVSAQLPFVERFYHGKGNLVSEPRLYLATFLPALLPLQIEFAEPLVTRDGRGVLGLRSGIPNARALDAQFYADNVVLDHDKTGGISMLDLQVSIDRAKSAHAAKYAEHLARYGLQAPAFSVAGAAAGIAALVGGVSVATILSHFLGKG